MAAVESSLVFTPLSLWNGWEMLPAFGAEEIPNEIGGKKLKHSRKPKAVSSEETEDIFSRPIPEELVEKTVALLPYPYILDARKLSKGWNWKLSAATTDPGNAGFREMVKSGSNNWPSYFPLIFNKPKRFLAGFDRRNRCWVRLFQGPSDLEVRTESAHPPWDIARKVSGAGSLMCAVTEEMGIFVSNLFTGAWKWLPERPNMDASIVFWVCIFLDGPDNYKVLTMAQSLRGQLCDVCEVCTQLYESKSNSWTMKLSAVSSSPFVGGTGVYLNGVVYCTQYDIGNGMLEVWAYKVDEGTWHSIPHPLVLMLHTFRTFKLMVCQNQLILLVRLKRASFYDDELERPRIRRNSLILYMLDPLTEKFSEAYRGPQKPIPDASASLYVSDGDSIFFGKLRKRSKYLMEFNMRKRTWTSFPSSCVDRSANLVYSSFAFQPGKSPFIAV